MCRLVFVLALCKLSLVDLQTDGEPNGEQEGGVAIQEMVACGCELPIRTEYERLCSSDINFLTHLQLAGNGNPRCHNPVNVGPADDKCMSVVYTFQSTKVGGVTIDISTPRDAPGCEIVPQPGVKYSISGNQFQKDVVTCNDTNPGDFVFIVDETGSIGNFTYQNTVKPFLNLLKNALAPASGVSPSNFATITFDTTAKVQFGLQSGRTSAEISTLINGLTYSGGNTAIGLALALAATDVLVSPFDTDSNPNICILLTDGNNGGGISIADGAAQLKKKCPTIFAIGVGKAFIQAIFETIATDPDKVIGVADFSGLTQTLVDFIKENICTPTGETKKVCNVNNCLGIFKETDHDEFQNLKKIYDNCNGA